eukprot:6484643-Amphidinium_carterae.4
MRVFCTCHVMLDNGMVKAKKAGSAGEAFGLNIFDIVAEVGEEMQVLRVPLRGSEEAAYLKPCICMKEIIQGVLEQAITSEFESSLAALAKKAEGRVAEDLTGELLEKWTEVGRCLMPRVADLVAEEGRAGPAHQRPLLEKARQPQLFATTPNVVFCQVWCPIRISKFMPAVKELVP